MYDADGQAVSRFVTCFLDRAQGAANDVDQRCLVGGSLGRRFFVGKLVAEAYSRGRSEYISRIAPCSYIATFLVAGAPDVVRLTLEPSFNLYFRAPLPRAGHGQDAPADREAQGVYAAAADPAPLKASGRADMWEPWPGRLRPVPPALGRQYAALKRPQGGPQDGGIGIAPMARLVRATGVACPGAPCSGRTTKTGS